VTFSGSGPTAIVFAHGFGCDQKLWRFIAPAFEREFRVVRFDYVGAGRSEPSAYDSGRYANLDGYASDLIEVIEAAEGQKVVFVGHSVSGMVGILAAIRRPELFARLVLVCPSPRYLNDAPDYVGGFDRKDIEGLLDLMDKNPSGWAGFLAPLVMKNSDRPELGAELEASFCAMKPEVARQFAQVTFLSDNRADLANVKTPALILQCADDAVAPEAVGRFMHARLAGSTYHAMRATGHCPHVSHPDETIAAIRSYLVLTGMLPPESNA
jgi:sigma-B regulation protein RsbQ